MSETSLTSRRQTFVSDLHTSSASANYSSKLAAFLYPGAVVVLLASVYSTLYVTGWGRYIGAGLGIPLAIFIGAQMVLLWHKRMAILYQSAVAFLRVCLNIFFKTIDVVGLENVPKSGPMIICGNHQNQFVDGVMLTTICGRELSLLIAAKSFSQPIVGHLAKAMHAIPVVRPQDVTTAGSGVVTAYVEEGDEAGSEHDDSRGSGSKVFLRGTGTEFTQELHAKDTVVCGKVKYKVESVESDTLAVVTCLTPAVAPGETEGGGSGEGETRPANNANTSDNDGGCNSSNPIGMSGGSLNNSAASLSSVTSSPPPATTDTSPPTPILVSEAAYKIMPKLDHSQMYSSVYSSLASGRGIFPEGGSHDRTELLPLKIGVAFMALGACVENPHLIGKLRIVCAGLNYFKGHRFRSKCAVEFGPGFTVTQEMVDEYKMNKRAAVDAFIARVKEGLAAVTINVPDVATLRFVHTCRWLYQPANVVLDAAQQHQLNHRFAVALEHLKDEPKFIMLKESIDNFIQQMDELAMRPKDIATYQSRIWIFPYFLFVLVVAALAAVPGILLNLPVGAFLRYRARQEASRALANSSVKLAGRDVIASYKIAHAMVLVPAWFVFVSICLVFFSGLPWPYGFLFFVLMPLFSYLGVRFTEQGVLVSKALYPLWLRLLPGYNVKHNALRERMAELQLQVRTAVEEFGPRFDFFKDRIISKQELKEKALEADEPYYDDEFDMDDFLSHTGRSVEKGAY